MTSPNPARTIRPPEDLFAQVQVLCARQRRSVNDLTTELYRRYVAEVGLTADDAAPLYPASALEGAPRG